MADIQQGRQDISRLQRRFDSYRSRNTVSTQRFETGIETIYGDQKKQTTLLKQRHIESKAKKSNKKSSESKRQDNPILGTMGQSKLLARTHDQSAGDSQDNEPTTKKPKLINGNSDVNSSDLQISQQLRNIKSGCSPSQSTVPQAINNAANPSSSVASNTELNHPILDDSDKCLVLDPDDIKKEGFDLIGLPSESMLEIFGSMGVGDLDDIKIEDLDFDTIKQEDSNSALDTYLKEEVGDLFDPIVSNDSSLNCNSSGPLTSISKTNASPGYPQYSNTPPMSHASTPPFTSSSNTGTFTSSLPQQAVSSSSNVSFPNAMTKIRMNSMPIGQNDRVLAAHKLMQMAEVHQTKQSPSNNPVRPDYSFSNISGPQMASSSNQMYNNTMNQSNPIYNQGINNEMEIKRRQIAQQQYSMQQSTMMRPTSQNHNLPQQPQSSQKVTTPTPAQQQNRSPLQQPVSTQQQQQSSTQVQQQSSAQSPQQLVPSQPQTSQSQMQQQSQTATPGNQSAQLTGSIPMSGFSNRLSPMNSYAQPPSQMGMTNQYATSMCGGGINSSTIRGSFPNQTRGSSPIPSSTPQGQQNGMQSVNQSRYMQQQQMMGNVGMARSQIMARPPPPEYRQAAMMQQHQGMMGQGMAQMHPAAMNQMPYQNMRSGYRQSMGTNPMNTMAGGQILSQQTIPGNMKASLVGSINQGGSMSGTMPTSGMPMNQANMSMGNGQPSVMQRTRPTSMGMGTQIPPSRPEWRQMIMQQNQGGMMMGHNMRHQYQQGQQGVMISQGGQIMSVQRNQMMNIMNMQSSGMHNNAGIPMGSRMPQHVMHQQGQMRMGIPMNQSGVTDRASTNMNQNVISNELNQMGGSSSMSGGANMGQIGGPLSMGGGTSLNQMGGSQVMGGGNNLNQIGGSQVMGNGSNLSQMGGTPGMGGGNLNRMVASPTMNAGTNINQMGGSPVIGPGNNIGQIGGSSTMSIGSNPNQMVGSPAMGGGNTLSQIGGSSAMSGGNLNPVGGSPSMCGGSNFNSMSGGNNLNPMVGSPTMSGGNNMSQMVGSPSMGNVNMNPMVNNPMPSSAMNVATAPTLMTQTNHPRSPVTMGQMHPCSPVASNTVGQQRPLSNPSFTSQTNTSVGNSSSMVVSPQNRSPIMSGNVPSALTSNSLIQACQPGQGLLPNQNNSHKPPGGHRPDSRGNNKSSQPPTPNPPPNNSASNDFNILMNEGEFESLLH